MGARERLRNPRGQGACGGQRLRLNSPVAFAHDLNQPCLGKQVHGVFIGLGRLGAGAAFAGACARELAGHFQRGLAVSEPGYFGRLCSPHEVNAVTAACLAVEGEKFFAVGGFDERTLPVDLNDVDL